MPIPNEYLSNMYEAMNLIDEGQVSEGTKKLNIVLVETEKIWSELLVFEALETLGILASYFGKIGDLNTEITLLDKLCYLAEKDLKNKGQSATQFDISSTGMDFVNLGIAYKNNNQLEEAKIALNRGKIILKKIDYEVDIEKILSENGNKRNKTNIKNSSKWKFWK